MVAISSVKRCNPNQHMFRGRLCVERIAGNLSSGDTLCVHGAWRQVVSVARDPYAKHMVKITYIGARDNVYSINHKVYHPVKVAVDEH